ncbi:MAG: dimethylargininase [Ilumatobacteraceae bacterium]|jgi:dimethylargininase
MATDAQPVGIALVRPTGPELVDGLVTHIERTPIDIDRARSQWSRYVEALRDAGWQVAEVARAPRHPDAVFIEDTVVMFGDRAVLTRPGAPERAGETVGVAEALDALDVDVSVLARGRLDGGDVLKVGHTVYVGIGGRTDADGVAALSDLVSTWGWHVRGVPTTRVLHLKSAVTALPDGTVIGFEPLVDDPGAFDNFLAVPEESGSHVVLLGGDRVLMAADAPRTERLLSSLGLEVVTVDISEFQRLEGCVTCLSVRMRHRPRS